MSPDTGVRLSQAKSVVLYMVAYVYRTLVQNRLEIFHFLERRK